MSIHRTTDSLIVLALACCLMVCTSPNLVQAGELSALPEGRVFALDLPDLDRRQRSLDEFAGKVVLVNFWASWCTPCVREMPSIMRLGQAFSDQPFTVIGVNVAEGQRRVAAAARRLDLDFTVLLDGDGEAFAAWGGNVLPTSFVLDRTGRARYIALGPLEWDDQEVIEVIERLLQEPPAPTLAGE